MRPFCQERRGILMGLLLAVLAGCHAVIAPHGQPSGPATKAASTQSAPTQRAGRQAAPDAGNAGPSLSGPSLSGPPPAASPSVIVIPAQSICQNLQHQFQQIFLSTRQLHQRLFGLAEKQRRRLAADQRGYWPTLSLLANPRQPLHGQFARLLSGYVTARQHFIQQRCHFALPPSPVQQIKQMDSRHFQPASWPG